MEGRCRGSIEVLRNSGKLHRTSVRIADVAADARTKYLTKYVQSFAVKLTFSVPLLFLLLFVFEIFHAFVSPCFKSLLVILLKFYTNNNISSTVICKLRISRTDSDVSKAKRGLCYPDAEFSCFATACAF